MDKYCKFCGEELKDGVCANDHKFKKMCVNCSFMKENEDGGMVCTNEDNLNAIKEKMMSAASGVTDSYAIVKFEIEAQPLKQPTKKCGKWSLSEDVKEEMFKLFA
mgnify:CR=1 FL=1